MNTSQKGIDFIESWEKDSEIAYRPTPTDRWTISRGITFYEDGTPVKEGDTITQERSDELFANIIASEEKTMLSMLKQTPTQQQFDSLMSFYHWAGSGNFKASNLLAAFNNNPNDLDAIKAGFGRPWCNTLPGLVSRRKSEFIIYTTGVYTNHF